MRAKHISTALTGFCIVMGGCVDATDDVASVASPAAQVEPARTSVTLRFKAKVGDEDFACGRFYPGQGINGASITPQDFRFFIENVRLVSEQGEEVAVQLDDVIPYQTRELALLDFTDTEGRCTNGGTGTNLTVTGSVPAGSYRGVVFVNGVPEHLNHADPAIAPAPLQAPGASWNWLLGYRFLMAEAVTADYQKPAGGMDHGSSGMGMAPPASHGEMAPPPAHGGSDAGMGSMPMPRTPGIGMLHIGSTACSGNPALGFKCQKANRNEVRLDDFDPSVNTIVADFGAIFRGSDLKVGTECHSGSAPCIPMFEALGVDYATGNPLDAQRVFRVE